MSSVGKINVDLVLNKQQFTREVKNIPHEVNAVGNRISSAFSKIGKAVAVAYSVKAVIAFTKKMIETTAQIKAADSQFEQTFGSLSDSATAAMDKVAKESGIVKSRLQGVGTSIYAFAKTTGMDSSNALKMMQEALQVTADSAAYYDRSLEDTAESLKSFLKGNYANDAALGLSCTETTRNTAANKLYGKSFRDLSESQKQLTLLQMVKDANAASGALGQAARESDGLENVLGNLKESWNQLLATVGKPILNTAVIVIQRITVWIQRMTDVAKAAISALSDLFGWQADDPTESVQQTSEAIGGAADNQAELTKEVKKTNDEVKRGLASFDKLNVISRSKSDSDDDSDNSEINNPLTSSIGNSIAADVELNTDNAKTKIDELKEKFKKILQPVVDFYNRHIKPIVDKLKDSATRIGEKFNEILDGLDLEPIEESIGYIFDKIDELVETLLPDIEDSIDTYIKPVLEDITQLILPTILNLIGNIIGFITPIIHGLYTLLKPIWENILQPAFHKIAEWFEKIGQKIGPHLEELGGKLGMLFEKLTPIVEVISKILGPAIEAVLDIIGGKAMTVLEIIIDTIGDIVDALGGLADFISGVFSGDWEKAWDGMADFVLGIVNVIIDILNGLWQGIYYVVALIGNAIGGLIKGLGSLFGQDWGWEMPTEAPLIQHLKIPSHESSGGGSHSGGGREIGHYASGGVFTAPTLAIVGDNAGAGSGDPEVVSPLSKLQNMMNAGNQYDTTLLQSILDYLKRLYEQFVIYTKNGGNTYQFVATLNGKTLFEEFVEQVRLYKTRYGALPW